MWNDKELSYRRSAIQGASTIGLVIALYDTLSGDFRRAAAAIRANNIERRCAELNHAALVLGQLENWVDVNSGEELAQNLVVFYGFLRAKMLEASLQQSAPTLEELIELVLQVRGAWQQRDNVASQPVPAGAMQAFSTSSTMSERIAFSV